MKVYKVHCNGIWCAHETLDQAIDFLKTNIETEAANLLSGEETYDYHIEVDEMAEEEFAALPDFDGY